MRRNTPQNTLKYEDGAIADEGRTELLEKERGNEAVAHGLPSSAFSRKIMTQKQNFKLLPSFLSHFATLSWKNVFLEPLIMQEG